MHFVKKLVCVMEVFIVDQDFAALFIDGEIQLFSHIIASHRIYFEF